MTLWIFIALLCLITLFALFFSARNRAQDKSDQPAKENSNETEQHFKLQLADIEANLLATKLSETDAQVARAELAREIVQHRAALSDVDSKLQKPDQKMTGWILGAVSLASIGLALIVYLSLGSPDQSIFTAPQALQDNAQQNSAAAQFAVALEKVEQQMIADPGDVRGWQVLGPAYMRLQRFDDAVGAYRKVLELSPPTADSQTDLAEALLMASSGDASPEVIQLLQDAAQSDETHTRSRFYLAAEATRKEQWDEAIAYWQELLALSSGQEQWVEIAQNGLAVAMARGAPLPEQQTVDTSDADTPDSADAPQAGDDQSALILSMVQRLDERLSTEGGTIEEWTRLVRSFLVLGETDKALNAYNSAKTAFPDSSQRAELEAIAQQAGFSQN